MTNEKDIKVIIKDLINRQFEIPDIKEHLFSIGYSKEEIEINLNEIVNNQESNRNTVTPREGSRGLGFIISGLIILISILVYGRESDSQVFTVLRLILGLFFLGGGIFLVTRPLKDE